MVLCVPDDVKQDRVHTLHGRLERLKNQRVFRQLLVIEPHLAINFNRASAPIQIPNVPLILT